MRNPVHKTDRLDDAARASRRGALARLGRALTAAATSFAPWARAGNAPALPPELREPLAGASLQGATRFRWLGFAVYDARLWSRVPVSGDRHAMHPFGLELVYARPFEGRSIAERSIDEMQRQGEIAPADRAAWLGFMREAFPDVDAGDRLTGLHRPDAGAAFFHNGRATEQTADREFSRRFFGIWLAPETSAPGLRRALLGGHG